LRSAHWLKLVACIVERLRDRQSQIADPEGKRLEERVNNFKRTGSGGHPRLFNAIAPPAK
jgi:hypothetical protein